MFDTLLGQELRRIRLTLAQARTLASIAGGNMFDPYATGLLLYAEASDAFNLARQGPGGDISSYATTFGIEEEPLLAKLLAVGPTADLALRDALSRWWADTRTDDSSDPNDEAAADRRDTTAFRDVGLTIVEAGR